MTEPPGGGRNKPSWGGGAMLGLTDQVGGHYQGVRRVVRDDPDLSRPGNLVYSHSTKQLSLGLCHKFVARSHNYICLLSSEQSKS